MPNQSLEGVSEEAEGDALGLPLAELISCKNKSR